MNLSGADWFVRGLRLTCRTMQMNPEGGIYSMMAYTGRLRPKGVTFFRLQLYERVGISLIEVPVYKRVGKSVIWVCERAQKG